MYCLIRYSLPLWREGFLVGLCGVGKACKKNFLLPNCNKASEQSGMVFARICILREPERSYRLSNKIHRSAHDNHRQKEAFIAAGYDGKVKHSAIGLCRFLPEVRVYSSVRKCLMYVTRWWLFRNFRYFYRHARIQLVWHVFVIIYEPRTRKIF